MSAYLEGSDFRCCSFKREAKKDAEKMFAGERDKPFNFGNGSESGERFYEAYCIAVEIYKLQIEFGKKILEHLDKIILDIVKTSNLYTKRCLNTILLEVEESNLN